MFKVSVLPAGKLRLVSASFLMAAVFAIPAVAYAQSSPDLAPPGWTRNASLSSLKIDQYTLGSGTIDIDLLAFPKTTETAKSWGENFIQHMTQPDKDKNHKIHVADDESLGSKIASDDPNVDMASHTVMVLRPGRDQKNLILSVRTIIRKGEPVQVSLLRLNGDKASETDWEQANKIRYDARLPVNSSAAILGLESMIQVMTSGLIYPEAAKPALIQQPQTHTHKTTEKTKRSAPKVKPTQTVRSVKNSGRAPLLVDIPGPRVKVTGKVLGSLPAGYRMHVATTNYWTNSSMTATRMKHLKLTKDGQFEKGHFSVSGSIMGDVGVTTTGDKHGSTGSVLGSSNPGTGRGAQSVYLKTRKGLDPSKYGTYYISGKQLELRYANGKSEKLSFKTDGYHELVIGDKRYFTKAPTGWEMIKEKKLDKYRSLDGAYIAKVSKVSGSVPNGTKWMQDYIARGKSKGLIINAGPIKPLKAGRHGVVKSTMKIRGTNGGAPITRDMYLRYGANSTVSRFVQVTRYKGASGETKLLAFVKDL